MASHVVVDGKGRPVSGAYSDRNAAQRTARDLGPGHKVKTGR
jgi:hypothetical protein